MFHGTFTSNQHVILLHGVTKDGEIIVRDPNINNVKKYKTDIFTKQDIINSSRRFYIISKK